MKKFIQVYLYVFVFFLVLWGGAEWFVGEIDTEYTHKYRYVKNNSSISTLLMGASLFENCINPHLLQEDSIYNFATSGRWIYWDVLLAEKLFPSMPNLKIVLFPVAYDAIYSSLHYRKCEPSDEQSIYKYSKYMHVYYDRLPQKYTCRSALYMNEMGFRLWQPLRYDELGYRPKFGMQSRNWESAPDTIIFANETERKCYKEYIEYLKQLAKVCSENNIRFIVVTPPCADCYIRHVIPEGINNLYSMVDSVRAYYPIEYKNYLNDFEFRADSIYFNATHLNSEGADMFARRVKADFGL